MKKSFWIPVLAIAALLAGCSLMNSPKAALQKFAKAVEKNDMKALADVATPETVQLVAAFGSKIQGYLATAETEKGKVKTVTEKIDGDTAVVTVAYENGDEEDFDLVKVDGKWKVSISMNK